MRHFEESARLFEEDITEVLPVRSRSRCTVQQLKTLQRLRVNEVTSRQTILTTISI